jgi:hypothetical protein
VKGIGNLKFGENIFDIEEANCYGVFESHGFMTWHIEIFPKGDENYIMLNSLIFDDIFSPNQLSEKNYNAVNGLDDLYEHTVIVNSEERFLTDLNITFGKWDTESQSISLSGKGAIDTSDNSSGVFYEFNTILIFKDLNLFETTQENAKIFLDKYLPDNKDKINIRFEKPPSGLHAIISGQF